MRTYLAIVFLLSTGAVDTVGVQPATTQNRPGLNPKIPPAIAAKYKGIRDARDWRNPMVIVRAEGIELVSTAIPNGRKTVPLSELRDLLISLPVSAWPYGRVVLASDLGLRRGDRSDDAPIERNHAAAEKILKGLDIVVDWWPS